ncbi:hypothetical protein PCS_00055 [Desulfocurvibacter africanus PCS]|uniref:Capsular exopolysaccharide biosynthesis protein n=1 Tax=Desulfocurvibacter africanus PCS TaxID=1262666 RepID=M5PYJ0_DESAF|nr:polysaccharide biosynthesis tyrosine autokinase [Desulfocurvibacter africanus]EMG39169.1 hypothetical protein PCS_00055 [Desulfocurvibacter africanus PCS]
MVNDAFRRKYTMRDVAGALFRRKGLIFGVAAFCTLAVAGVTFLVPPVYKSSATMLLRLGRESVAMDPSMSAEINPVLSLGQARDAEMKTEMEILKSEDLAATVVRELGPERVLREFGPDQVLHKPPPASMNKSEVLGLAVREFLKRLEVGAPVQGNTLLVTYEAEDPNFARYALSIFLDRYRDYHAEVYRSGGSSGFFEQQTHALRDEVNALEQQLSEYKRETNTADLEGERALLMERLKEARSKLDEVGNSLDSSISKVDFLGRTLAELPREVVTGRVEGVANSASEAMRAKLFELRVRYQEMRSKYYDDSLPMVSLKREIEEAERMVAQEEPYHAQKSFGLNAVREEIRGQLLAEQAQEKALGVQKAGLATQIDAMEWQLRRIIEAERSLRSMERERNIKEENYRKYAQLAEQARIDSALVDKRISNLSVIQAPSLPMKPYKPKKALNLAMGLFVGLFGGLTLAMLMEIMDQRLSRPEELAALGVTALAALPKFRYVSDRISIESHPTGKSMLPDSPRGAPPAVAGKRLLATVAQMPLLRSFRVLTDRVLVKSLKEGDHKSLLFTSSNAGEGVTFIATRIANLLASGCRERVLLIDGDVHSPSLHSFFGFSLDTPGFIDLASGKAELADVVRRSLIPGLDIIHAGQSNNGHMHMPSFQMLQSGGIEKLLMALEGRYDHILIDGAPVQENSSALCLSKIVDGVVLVVEAEKTRRQVVQHTLDLLSGVNAKVLGGVLNKRNFHLPRWLYQRL